MSTFHQDLKRKMDSYVHMVYRLTKRLPKEEQYGLTSQLRRSSLSVILNYIEGYARMSGKAHRNFLTISYGSLKESKYLLHFCFVEKYIEEDEYEIVNSLADDIGAMLWGIIDRL